MNTSSPHKSLSPSTCRLKRVQMLPIKSCENIFFFFPSRRRHTSLTCDWSSDVCSSDLCIVKHLQGTSLARRFSCNTTGQCEAEDRKSVVQGKSVDLGGRRLITTKP